MAVNGSAVLRVGAVLLAAGACAATPPGGPAQGAWAAPEKRPAAPSPVVAAPYPPRLVRQPFSGGLEGPGTQADGVLRRVRHTGWHEWVEDPERGTVFAEERFEDPGDASIDPSFRVLCVEQREFRAYAPTFVGAFNLATRRWLWRRPMFPENVRGSVVRVLAAPAFCAFQARTVQPDRSERDSIELRALADGARIEAGSPPPFNVTNEAVARWTDDRSTVVLTQSTRTEGNVPGILVDVRDGRTLARRAQLWARCVEVGAGLSLTVHEGIENEQERARIQRLLPGTFGGCTPRPDPPARPRRGRVMAEPWIALSDTVVAVHRDDGLFLWDHARPQPPYRVARAPGLVRFDDVNGYARGLEPVVPPDASWIGVVATDGTLLRFSTATGAPLAPVAPAGPLPVTARDASWQVFAGASDRLIALRNIDRRRAVFVGTTQGLWKRSPASLPGAHWQDVEYLDGEHEWLVGDGVHGVQRIDEASGRITARFDISPHTFVRAGRPIRSPDGREIFVEVADSDGDDHGGLNFLDARSLRRVRRFPYVDGIHDAEAWGPDGIVLVMGGDTPDWARLDPRTGAIRRFARGELRERWRPSRRGAMHVDRTSDGGALIGGTRGTPERRMTMVPDGGAAIAYPDGHVWCHGAGCDVYRCVISPVEARPARDSACAHLRGGE